MCSMCACARFNAELMYEILNMLCDMCFIGFYSAQVEMASKVACAGKSLGRIQYNSAI